jgi:hypothetical protein
MYESQVRIQRIRDEEEIARLARQEALRVLGCDRMDYSCRSGSNSRTREVYTIGLDDHVRRVRGGETW